MLNSDSTPPEKVSEEQEQATSEAHIESTTVSPSSESVMRHCDWPSLRIVFGCAGQLVITIYFPSQTNGARQPQARQASRLQQIDTFLPSSSLKRRRTKSHDITSFGLPTMLLLEFILPDCAANFRSSRPVLASKFCNTLRSVISFITGIRLGIGR